MSGSLGIDGKKLEDIKVAALQTGYSRDYITKLAREQKIFASQIGRQWYVDLASLQNYATAMAAEQKTRQQKLSDERKRERQLRESFEKQLVAHRAQVRRQTHRSRLVVGAVLIAGLTTGITFARTPLATTLFPQAASVSLAQFFGINLKPEIAVAVSEGEQLTFSDTTFELQTLQGSQKGILLLPQGTTSNTIAQDFFSDRVKIVTGNDGRQYIGKFENGRVVAEVPFVTVPVSNIKTP